MPTQFDIGFLVGLLVGEGHFGGDGRQPQVTLRMHVRHEAIFRWLERTFPGGRLYGPYHHGGRDYLQWMARGPYLRDELVPLLDRWLSPDLDRHSFDRFQLMKARYLRKTQGADGGWPLFFGGALDLSASVKAYFALKAAGDPADAPHMARARAAILARGGARR